MPSGYSSTRSNRARAIVKAQLPAPCTICGGIVTEDMRWHADHIFQRAFAELAGWSELQIDAASNLGPAHGTCDSRKNKRPSQTKAQRIEKKIAKLERPKLPETSEIENDEELFSDGVQNPASSPHKPSLIAAAEVTEGPSNGFVAIPRYISPLPDSVDIQGAHSAAEKMGISLLPQGEQVASLLEAKNEDGTPLFPECVIQMGRRATKTSSIQATLLGRCFSIPGYRIISTAQSGTLSQQFLAELGSQLEMAYPDEATRPFRFYKSNGSIRIVWDNGSQWRAVKPQASAFRGSFADTILLDEAGELDEKTTEDLLAGALPVMATRPNSQLIITGTPPKTREGLLWKYLVAGRKGTEDLGILDYSMETGEDATDEALWYRVYPGLSSGLVSIKFLRKALETQGLASFSREFLCLDPTASNLRAIDAEDWEATRVAELLDIPATGFSASFDVAPDGSSAALGVAWYDSNGQPCVQLLSHKSGYSWLPSMLAKLLQEHRGLPVVYDRVGNNIAVVQELQRKRNIPQSGLESIGAKEVSAGVAIFMASLSDRNLIHATDPSLDSAVEGANFRYLNDSRLFGRRNSTEDVSPLVAVSNALYHAAGQRTRSNGRVKARVYS